MSKILETRISQKHDFESNWVVSDLVPYQGEIIVYDAECDLEGNPFEGVALPEGRTDYISYPRIKIGDGEHSVNDLPFASNGEGGVIDSEALQEHITAKNPHKITAEMIGAAATTDVMPKSGGTFTGQVIAQENTDYETYQMRNITIRTTVDDSLKPNGSIQIIYS